MVLNIFKDIDSENIDSENVGNTMKRLKVFSLRQDKNLSPAHPIYSALRQSRVVDGFTLITMNSISERHKVLEGFH